MAKRPKRARSERRDLDRQARKLREDILKLEAVSPGGSPDRPLSLLSPSQAEPDAEGRPCPLCAGGMRATDHRAVEHEGRRLRVVDVVCKQCHHAWTRYYQLAQLN